MSEEVPLADIVLDGTLDWEGKAVACMRRAVHATCTAERVDLIAAAQVFATLHLAEVSKEPRRPGWMG